jgi:hypothetical protein
LYEFSGIPGISGILIRRNCRNFWEFSGISGTITEFQEFLKISKFQEFQELFAVSKSSINPREYLYEILFFFTTNILASSVQQKIQCGVFLPRYVIKFARIHLFSPLFIYV